MTGYSVLRMTFLLMMYKASVDATELAKDSGFAEFLRKLEAQCSFYVGCIFQVLVTR